MLTQGRYMLRYSGKLLKMQFSLNLMLSL